MNSPILISLFAFLLCLLASLALYVYLSSRETVQVWKRRVENRLDTLESSQEVSWIDSLKTRFTELVESLGKAVKPSNEADVLSIRQSLITAGYRHPRAPILFLGAKLVAAIFFLLAMALVPTKTLGFPSYTLLIMYYVLAAFLGYYLPDYWLRWTIGSRKQRILHALPDALDLMVVCVEAGLGLDQAINRVGDEIKFAHRDLSDEFNLLALELRTGVTRSDALRNLSRRIDLEEFKSLVALLIQTDRFGTSIGQALRVHSDAMKVSRRMKAEELAAKLPVKLLFPLLFFIFPNMFIVVLGPAAIRVIRTLLPALSH
ncbi:MAG: type II secretion system F family protein [Nitrospiraceae bacterium]